MTTNKRSTPSEQARAKRLAYQRKYYRLHKAKARKYYRANQEKIKERAEQWREENRARYLKQQAMYDLYHRGRMYPEDRIRRAYDWLYKARANLEDSTPNITPKDQKAVKNHNSPRKRYYPPARW